MQVEALGLSQEMDFGDGSVTNFLTLRLPSGDLVKALVSDAAVERIAANLAGIQTGQPVSAPPAPREVQAPAGPPPPPYQATESEAVIFGGDGGLSAPVPVPAAPVVRPKIVRVEKDSMGYPIVRTAGGNSMDTDSAIGGGAIQDEDGIGQG